MNRLASPPALRIRRATVDDGDAVVELASLVDLHLPPGHDAVDALAPLRKVLTESTDGPLSHGSHHFLIAEDRECLPVGLIACGPAKWMAAPGRLPTLVRDLLRHRISTVHLLATRPDHRRHGVATNLLQQTEQTFRDAGYAALTLRHDRTLTAFYRGQGYTSANRLSLMLPKLGLFTITDRPWKHAFKVLNPGTSVSTVQGLPTITGVLHE